MSGEIIQSVAYDNYDDFQHVNFLFSLNFITLFWELLIIDEIDLMVKYALGFLMSLWCKIFL
jgi:hypothetical protein